MNVANVEHVFMAIRNRMDLSGYGTATLTQLVMDTGLSLATVKRAIQLINESGSMVIESKKGQKGGLLFGPSKQLKQLSETAQTAQKTELFEKTRNAFNHQRQTPSGSSLVSGGAPNSSANSSAAPESPRWFVCCTWYDEKGQMWTHGRDGLATYMPCDSKEDAMELAENHSHMFHKDKQQRYGVLPAVDVCETVGDGDRASKTLHYRYGTLGASG